MPDRRDATGPRPLVDDFEVIVDDATPPPGDLSDSQRRQWVLVAALRREVVDLRDKVASHDRVRGVLVKVVAAIAAAALGSLGAAYSATRSAAERDGRSEATMEALQRDTAAANHRVEVIESILLRSPALIGPRNP